MSPFDIFSLTDKKKDFSLFYHLREASPKPYRHFFNSQTFVSTFLGGITKSFLSISSPCKKAVLISMAFNFHFLCAINASIILRASLEQVGESFNISSLYISSKPWATPILSMILKEQTHFSHINFCPLYGTSV